MSRRVALAAPIAVAALLVAPGAGAQSSSSAILLGSPFGALGKAVSEQTINTQVTGQLVVSFRGDPAGGCSGRGLCGYAGTVVVRPTGRAQFQIETLRAGGARAYLVGLSFNGAVTGSEVSRRGGSSQDGRCADEKQPDAFLSPAVQKGIVTIAVLQPGGSLLNTRCAGPLDSDLLASGPSATLPIGQLLKGEQTVDLARTSSFAADGLAGTVSSTLQLRLARPSRAHSVLAGVRRKVKFRRVRIATEKLSLTALSGTLQAAVRGTSDRTACALLDSCGFSGTLSDTPSLAADSAVLTAIGSAKLASSRFVAALHGKRERGIAVLGEIVWGPGGSLAESLSGSGESCTDTAPGAGAFLVLLGGKRAVSAAYGPAPLRTRCPGPVLGGLSSALARGQLPVAEFSHSSFTVTLRGSGAISDDGYNVSVGGALKLSLRRGPISQRVVRLPNG